MSRKRPRLIHKRSASLTGQGCRVLVGHRYGWWRPILAVPRTKLKDDNLSWVMRCVADKIVCRADQMLPRTFSDGKSDSSMSRQFMFRDRLSSGRLPTFLQLLVRKASHVDHY